MTKYIHKVKADDILNDMNLYDTQDYLGIKFTMETQVFNNFIGLFLRARLPFGYEKVDCKIKLGILNTNNSFVNKYVYEYTFSYGMDEAIGNKTFVKTSDINKYIVNGDIYIGYEIVKCDYESNQTRMIQKIYQTLYQKNAENDLLKYQNHQLNKEKELSEEKNKSTNNQNTKLKIKNDNLHFKYNELLKDMNHKDKYIKTLLENIEMKDIEIDELRREVQYYSPDIDMNEYIQVTKAEDSEDEERKVINIYRNKYAGKYNVNILDLDKVSVEGYSLYDLKVMQNKLFKLQTIISDKITEHNSCKICYTNDLNCILLPCGHQCCCDECSKNINSKCPMCRKPVANVFKTF